MSAMGWRGEGGPWTPHAIASLAERCMGRAPSVYYAPSIPHAKLGKARAAHALHLPEDEAILVLYDDTVLGSAREGFLVTIERLCWKNLWEHPRQIAWRDLEPLAVAYRGGKISVAGGELLMREELAPLAATFFIEMASRLDAAQVSPYRTAELPPPIHAGAMPSMERLIALTRRHVGEVEDLYFAPSIPTEKLARARAAHEGHLPPDELVAVLFDDTVFGSAEEGFLFTSLRLCWKNISTEAGQLLWSEISPSTITVDESSVRVMGGELHLTARKELVGPVAQLLRVILAEVQSGGQR